MNSYSPSPSITAPDDAFPQREPEGIAAWFRAFQTGNPAAYRYLLILRCIVINLIATAVFFTAWLQGWIDLILAGDSTHQVVLIFFVFLAGLALCIVKIIQTSRELNEARSLTRHPRSRTALYLALTEGRDGQSRAISASALKLKLSGRIEVIRHIANSLVLLGLIGTVIGFMMALAGVDPNEASDVGAIGPMVTTLIDGMSVALTTTLVGALLNIWLMVNFRLLESGTLRLFTGIVELGERNVRS